MRSDMRATTVPVMHSRSAQAGRSGGSDTSPSGMHDSPEKITGGLSQEVMRGLVLPGRRGLRLESTQKARHAMNHLIRLQWLTRLCILVPSVSKVRSKPARGTHRSSVF